MTSQNGVPDDEGLRLPTPGQDPSDAPARAAGVRGPGLARIAAATWLNAAQWGVRDVCAHRPPAARGHARDPASRRRAGPRARRHRRRPSPTSAARLRAAYRSTQAWPTRWPRRRLERAERPPADDPAGIAARAGRRAARPVARRVARGRRPPGVRPDPGRPRPGRGTGADAPAARRGRSPASTSAAEVRSAGCSSHLIAPGPDDDRRPGGLPPRRPGAGLPQQPAPARAGVVLARAADRPDGVPGAGGAARRARGDALAAVHQGRTPQHPPDAVRRRSSAAPRCCRPTTRPTTRATGRPRGARSEPAYGYSWLSG